ncbi:MAG: RidA family protein [Bacteroidales bacterium]|jgi:2-iminobutanoate/2-iminopropanoate deaminase
MRELLAILVLFVGFSLPLSAQETASSRPIAPFSPSVITADGTLYISGQLPMPESGPLITGDIKKATEQCMKNLGGLLKKHGLTYEDLVMVNIYMTDMDNYKVINEVYATFFKEGIFPARVAVQVAHLPMKAEVEISGIAKAGEKSRK